MNDELYLYISKHLEGKKLSILSSVEDSLMFERKKCTFQLNIFVL